ncbi:HGGxSTG domain-containing protein [Aliiroseovarius sp. xm-a-134]|uniref:HGGxSTG domain-containing protein n=2 Tax=Aliiroseovarius TaxID=1658781 RepID=UPI0035304CC4
MQSCRAPMKTTFLPDFARTRGGVLGRFGPSSEKLPESLCGATTRKGAPCKAKALPGKERCRFHGGASTGPKTPEGRERIATAQRQRWAKWRAEKLQGD